MLRKLISSDVINLYPVAVGEFDAHRDSVGPKLFELREFFGPLMIFVDEAQLSPRCAHKPV